ncbi:YhfC family intramembrane metalloprotease [Paenibacillus rigui]|uniref:YhfC family intramembrane metalloprotease n=1 Tax=Paenibacillus rigui TaxID=554312 RepID=A0A229UII9_9BACL|nr:YhfC family intramembrane metalloprotease [Paenibacillus rigui]OXM83183.1 YhfC family intramembrane metalloprotease [Paenibacillus rigui]
MHTISTLTLTGMVLQIGIVLIWLVVAFVYARKREHIGIKPVLIGAVVFLVFSQVLEKLLHVFMLQLNPSTAAWLQNPWLYAMYGALAAGIFEELGRYVGLRWWLKQRWSFRDGVAFGLGHGGLEALLIGVVGGIQMLVLALMYSAGTLQQAIGGKLPAEAADALVGQLTGATLASFLLAGFERIPAMLLHVALSLLVLQGVRESRFRYVGYAIAAHALIDFFPALYQKQMLSLATVEILLLLVGIGSVLFIRNAKRQALKRPV